MKGLKKILGNYLLLSAVCIILGAALIASPSTLINVISYTIGGLSLAVAAIEIGRFLMSRNAPSGENDTDSPGGFVLVRGIILAVIGVFLILKPDFLAQVFAFSFGLYMLASGGISLYDSLRIKKQDESGWQMACALATVTVIGGIIILMNPMLPANIMITVLGILLVVTGVSNLIGSVVGKNKLETLLKLEDDDGDSKKKKKDRNFIDVN